MHWKQCECCGDPMIGVHDCPTPARRECEPCGGKALWASPEDPDRIAAKRELERIYAGNALLYRCAL